ncbi:MAG: helix-turn-helix transcriptional regulator [Geodermatophilaceae bacterium]|nr:helix-turn-helix transcriptional regulator [Geodermatophilaceae bacterium]
MDTIAGAGGYVPDVLDPECPTRKVLDRIGDRWTVLVVLHLLRGSQRFTRLRERVGGVAPKALTHTLRAMERDGLIHREVFAEVPPRVEYSLTDLGRTLEPLIVMITEWAEAHIGRVEQAHAEYESR